MKYELTSEQIQGIRAELEKMPIGMAGQLYNFFVNLKPVEEKKDKKEKEKK